MANWFVRSAATGTGAGTSWTNATTTIAAAITLSTAGDTFFVADDHAETTASALTLVFKGSLTAPDTVLCADHTITSPTSTDLKTTGSVTTTGNVALVLQGSFYCYGMNWNCGTSTNAPIFQIGNAAALNQIFQSNAFNCLASGNMQFIVSNSQNSHVKWINCSMSFAGVGHTVQPRGGSFEWVDTATPITGATIPTILIAPGSFPVGFRFEGVDFSALTSGKTLFSMVNCQGSFLIKDCKLSSAATFLSGSGNQNSWRLDMIRCDSGNTNYRNESYQLNGSQVTETTIVRSGGATDGVTGFSHKIVTTSAAKWQMPYESLPLAIWNDTSGSAKTITVEGIASAVPNNDEVWMDVEYLGSTTSPLGSFATTTKANILATGAANTTSSATWGGALTGKFSMAATITPQQKGPITVYVKVAKASTTVYIDPLITVT